MGHAISRLLCLSAVAGAVIAVVSAQQPDALAKQPNAGKDASVDLLELIVPRRDAVQGKWLFRQKALYCASGHVRVLQVPYLPPEEYDLEIEVERIKGIDMFGVGLRVGRNQPNIILDGWNSTISGISRVDGNSEVRQNGTGRPGKVFPDRGPLKVVCRVRKGQITVFADGQRIIHWAGDPGRLGFHPDWEVPHKGTLSLVAVDATYCITKLTLTPVKGKGQPLK